MSGTSVSKLANQLAQVAVTGKPKKKKKQAQPKVVVVAKKRSKPRNKVSPSLGTMRLRERELLASVKVGTSVLYPGVWKEKSGTPPSLAKVQKMFSRIKFHSLKVWWIGTAGTTVGGSVIMAWDKGGVFRDSDVTKVTRQQVAATQPNLVMSAWVDGTNRPLSLSGVSLLGSVGNGWFDPKASDFSDGLPALLVVNVAGAEAMGDIWIEYDVTLDGLNGL